METHYLYSVVYKPCDSLLNVVDSESEAQSYIDRLSNEKPEMFDGELIIVPIVRK